MCSFWFFSLVPCSSDLVLFGMPKVSFLFCHLPLRLVRSICHLFMLQRFLGVGHQWLMPVILTTWEAKIGRITVWSQPRQIIHDAPISKKTRAKLTRGMVQYGSSSRVPLQAWSPFAPKKKKKFLGYYPRVFAFKFTLLLDKKTSRPGA
jgi:hypothetical protein